MVLEGISRARLIAADGKPDNSGQPDNNEKPGLNGQPDNNQNPGQDGNDKQEASKPKPATPASTDTKKGVKTGDGKNIELYLLLALIGAGGIVVTLKKAAINS